MTSGHIMTLSVGGGDPVNEAVDGMALAVNRIRISYE